MIRKLLALRINDDVAQARRISVIAATGQQFSYVDMNDLRA